MKAAKAFKIDGIWLNEVKSMESMKKVLMIEWLGAAAQQRSQ